MAGIIIKERKLSRKSKYVVRDSDKVIEIIERDFSSFDT